MKKLFFTFVMLGLNIFLFSQEVLEETKIATELELAKEYFSQAQMIAREKKASIIAFQARTKNNVASFKIDGMKKLIRFKLPNSYHIFSYFNSVGCLTIGENTPLFFHYQYNEENGYVWYYKMNGKFGNEYSLPKFIKTLQLFSQTEKNRFGKTNSGHTHYWGKSSSIFFHRDKRTFRPGFTWSPRTFMKSYTPFSREMILYEQIRMQKGFQAHTFKIYLNHQKKTYKAVLGKNSEHLILMNRKEKQQLLLYTDGSLICGDGWPKDAWGGMLFDSGIYVVVDPKKTIWTITINHDYTFSKKKLVDNATTITLRDKTGKSKKTLFVSPMKQTLSLGKGWSKNDRIVTEDKKIFVREDKPSQIQGQKFYYSYWKVKLESSNTYSLTLSLPPKKERKRKKKITGKFGIIYWRVVTKQLTLSKKMQKRYKLSDDGTMLFDIKQRKIYNITFDFSTLTYQVTPRK